MIYGVDKQEVLIDIAKEIQETQYGDVNVVVTTHRGIPVGLTTTSFRHEKYAPGQNSEALQKILSIFKQMVDTKQTGELTFTAIFNNGEIRELINQLYDKKMYKVDEKVDKI